MLCLQESQNEDVDHHSAFQNLVSDLIEFLPWMKLSANMFLDSRFKKNKVCPFSRANTVSLR